jgi:hypothetical protein
MRKASLLGGALTVTIISLFAAGVLSAATPIATTSKSLLCDIEMNPCTLNECQDWCDITFGPGTFANCGGVPPHECCRCFL